MQAIERGRFYMEHPGFFESAGPFTLEAVARATESRLAPGADGARLLHDVRPLGEAGPAHLSFLDNRKYLPQLATTKAAGCLVQPPFVERLPAGVAALVTKAPYRGFALALAMFYPKAIRHRLWTFQCPQW